MFADTVYKIVAGEAKPFLTGEQMPAPNGLLIHDEELIVASWGEGFDHKAGTTKAPGHLYSYNLKTKERHTLTKEPLGNLDGLENDGSGGYYVSDWVAGKVYHVAADRTATPILTGFKGAADIGVIEAKGLLIVPRMGEDKVTAFELESLR
jgi:sugar lactone lactonase YvrE